MHEIKMRQAQRLVHTIQCQFESVIKCPEDELMNATTLFQSVASNSWHPAHPSCEEAGIEVSAGKIFS